MTEHTKHKTETHHEHSNTITLKSIDEEKPVDNRKSLITVFVIVGIIIVIIAAVVLISKFMPNTNTVKYNNYTFEKFEGNKWMTQQLIRNRVYNIPFYYNPTQVIDIPADPNSVLTLRQFGFNPNGIVYITVDPNESSKVVLAGVEYARILGTSYNIYNMNVKAALSKPYAENISVNSPVITCNNQSKDALIIYQVVSNKNLISVRGNCIYLESINANESVRVADAFAFRLLSIIRE